MRLATGSLTFAALLVIALANPVLAQTPPQVPKPQAPSQPSLFTPQPTMPFPEGAKIGYIDFQLIAQTSAAGKAASLRLKSLHDIKFAEIEVKGQALKALQSQQSAAAGMTASAAAKLQKDIERGQMDIQYAQQLAQKEIDDLNEELMNEFSTKLKPVVEQVRAEKGLWAVLVVNESVAAMMPGLDLSMEVVKRLDAGKMLVNY
jgi:Skp family chaperone for outer membrane proteins